MSVTWTSSRQTLTLPLTRSGVLEALLLRPGADSALRPSAASQGEMGRDERGRWSHSSEVNMSAVLTHRKLPCSNLVVLSIYSTIAAEQVGSNEQVTCPAVLSSARQVQSRLSQRRTRPVMRTPAAAVACPPAA